MNYQKMMDSQLEEVKEYSSIPKLLLHACCAPCSSYTLEYLSNFFDITIYYYNPNIHPNFEYDRRKEELKKFISEINLKNNISLIEPEYNPNDYFNAIKGLENLGERSKRCYECYKLRMNKAFEYANKNKYDYFTTTLSISPYKDAKWINEIGEELQNQYKTKYLYADLKKRNGYKRSIELSKKYNLYRQDYCGCIYSKREREILI